MDIKKVQTYIIDFIKKYRYAVLVLAIGIVLMLLPGGNSNTSAEETVNQPTITNEISVSDELAQILANVEGAGKVKVMLTETKGKETVYQADEDRSESEDECTLKTETVIITDSEKNETALICQVNPPKYLGVIVLCQGADSASVRLAIIDAVSKVTGLGSDCISVLKMK